MATTDTQEEHPLDDELDIRKKLDSMGLFVDELQTEMNEVASKQTSGDDPRLASV